MRVAHLFALGFWPEDARMGSLRKASAVQQAKVIRGGRLRPLCVAPTCSTARYYYYEPERSYEWKRSIGTWLKFADVGRVNGGATFYRSASTTKKNESADDDIVEAEGEEVARTMERMWTTPFHPHSEASGA